LHASVSNIQRDPFSIELLLPKWQWKKYRVLNKLAYWPLRLTYSDIILLLVTLTNSDKFRNLFYGDTRPKFVTKSSLNSRNLTTT